VPLPWVRLDTAFPYNPKLLAMVGEADGHRAGLVYVCSLGYCGAHGTDGFIPREALPFIHGRMSDAKLLVIHGFWHEQPGGWQINDWTEFQESNTETKERSDRARKAARSRWNGHVPSSGAERMRRHRQNRNDSATSSDTSPDLRIVDNA
jgi:hypothetical protein